MVVPSNDLFIGNDNPTRYRLFDAAGNLSLTSIDQTVGQILDAGSEVADPANAAFLVGGNNDLRIAENGTVSFDAYELGAFDGLTTAAGYVFDNDVLTSASAPIYRISFTAAAVPEPATWAMMIMGFGAVAAGLRRRSAAPAVRIARA